MIPATTRAVMVFAIVMISCAGASADASACNRVPDALGGFQAAEAPKQAPDATFFEEGEVRRSLDDYRGNGLIVNFWATWCAPCVREMPALDRLRARFGTKDIEVLALSSDRGGAEVVRAFYAKNDIRNLDVMIDERTSVARALGVSALPTTVMFDADGREVGRVLGIAEWDAPDVVAFLENCLSPREQSALGTGDVILRTTAIAIRSLTRQFGP